jgi:16S rRNA (uracil1498-N3)-methyltransferase
VIAQTELPISVTLLLALPKTGMDDVVRQATEIGVQRIVPILSQRTVLNPSAQKLERWQRIIQEAAEQSERQLVPELLPPQAWEIALQTWNRTTGLCYLCEARGEHPHLLKCLLETQCLLDTNPIRGNLQPVSLQPVNLQPVSLQPVVSACMIAIGPEGGWTDQEIDQAVTAGYQPVSLGARILRSITAPLVALSLLAGVMEIQRDTVL